MEDIVIKNSDGVVTNYKVLLTFNMNEKDYVIYTDSNLELDTEIKVYYASYKDGNFSNLEPVENEDEIKVIDDIVEDFENILKNSINK